MALLAQCSWTEVSRGDMCRERKGMMPRRGRRQVSVDVPGEVKVLVTSVVEEECCLISAPSGYMGASWGDANARF